jgi:pSer/pThr/pTyr-binding forkhead associated (FHA) protein
MIKISVIDGAPAQAFELPEDVVSIGRSRNNALMLDDSTLSRKHCEIAAVNGRFLLVNHAKTNGTCVNGRPVGEAFLKPGDTILVGRVALRFEGGDSNVEFQQGAKKSCATKRRGLIGAVKGSDPVLYGISYFVGLAMSTLVYMVFR